MDCLRAWMCWKVGSLQPEFTWFLSNHCLLVRSAVICDLNEQMKRTCMNAPHCQTKTATAASLYGIRRVAISLFVVLGLSACDKADDRASIGQQLDTAIRKTEQLAAEAKSKTENSGTELKAKTEAIFANAGVALKDATENAEYSAKTVAAKATEKMDDMAITTAISAALAKDPEIKLLEINVDTKSGAVVLNGSVPTQKVRERAGAMAKTFSGVQSVNNQLTVKVE